MEDSPFKEVIQPLNQGEFASSSVFGQAKPAPEPKRATMSEAEEMLKTARVIESQARFARKTGNRAWLTKLRGYAESMLAQVGVYLKKAVEIAIYKFVVELCAMIMSALVGALNKKGGKPMDITTPGVFYSGQPGYQQQPAAHAPGTFGTAPTRAPDHSPFGDWGSNSRNTVSSW